MKDDMKRSIVGVECLKIERKPNGERPGNPIAVTGWVCRSLLRPEGFFFLFWMELWIMDYGLWIMEVKSLM